MQRETDLIHFYNHLIIFFNLSKLLKSIEILFSEIILMKFYIIIFQRVIFNDFY